MFQELFGVVERRRSVYYSLRVAGRRFLLKYENGIRNSLRAMQSGSVYFRVIDQVLIFNVIAATNNKHERFLERRPIFRNLRLLQLFRVQVQIIVDLLAVFELHQVIHDPGHG